MSYWLRWLLVLPAAAGSLIGIQFLNFIFVNVYVGLGFGMWAELLISLFYSFAAPYTFIMAGARVAPSHRFTASIVLAVLVAMFIGYSIYNDQLDFVTSAIYYIPWLSMILACRKLYKESKKNKGGKDNKPSGNMSSAISRKLEK